jgi:hypothetical protein
MNNQLTITTSFNIQTKSDIELKRALLWIIESKIYGLIHTQYSRIEELQTISKIIKMSFNQPLSENVLVVLKSKGFDLDNLKQTVGIYANLYACRNNNWPPHYPVMVGIYYDELMEYLTN